MTSPLKIEEPAKALRRDIHGKALSGPFLDMEVEVPDDFEPAIGPY